MTEDEAWEEKEAQLRRQQPAASDMPRTDEEAFDWHPEDGTTHYAEGEFVYADFARTLEREAAALRRERDEAAAREREAVRLLQEIISADDNNSGHEPSISVLYRTIEEAREVIRARSGEGRK